MTVKHVDADSSAARCATSAVAFSVAKPDLPAHRDPGQAERQFRHQVHQHRLGARAAGGRVGDQPDTVSARSLSARKVRDVAEQAADRGAQHVQDLQARSVPAVMRN